MICPFHSKKVIKIVFAVTFQKEIVSIASKDQMEKTTTQHVHTSRNIHSIKHKKFLPNFF